MKLDFQLGDKVFLISKQEIDEVCSECGAHKKTIKWVADQIFYIIGMYYIVNNTGGADTSYHLSKELNAQFWRMLEKQSAVSACVWKSSNLLFKTQEEALKECRERNEFRRLKTAVLTNDLTINQDAGILISKE